MLSRTGRRLLADPEPLLAAVREAGESAGLWDELNTEWLALDAELLPWTAAGTGLVADRYVPMSAAALADTLGGRLLGRWLRPCHAVFR